MTPNIRRFITNIRTFVFSLHDFKHEEDTAYHRKSLAQFLQENGGVFSEINLCRFPKLVRSIRKLRNSYKIGRCLGLLQPFYRQVLDAAANLIGYVGHSNTASLSQGVGKYYFTTSANTTHKIYIDSHDAGDIASSASLGWCDLYLKTSYTINHSYPPKVVPLYQCSFHLVNQLDFLRSLRQEPKKFDVCFTTRVWGGTNDIEGIEHNLRILEALSKLKCTKYLRAYLLAGDTKSYARRLDKLGIPWSFDPLPFSEHFTILAQSRLNVHRLGMHNSITWRMSEFLCMGACPVLDQPPRTLWPEPLRENQHYLTLNATPLPGSYLASEEHYEAIPERISKFLSKPSLIESIATANRNYFDRYLTPTALGRQICDTVLSRLL